MAEKTLGREHQGGWRRLGQYDSSKLINYGSNRWAFQAKIGLSRRGGLGCNTYGGLVFHREHDFFSQPSFRKIREQKQVSLRRGLSYDVSLGFWASFDGILGRGSTA